MPSRFGWVDFAEEDPERMLTKPPEPVERLGPQDAVVCERLGGLLRHCQRKAA